MDQFSCTERQKEAIAVMGENVHTMLFGGSRSGKTFIIVRMIIIRALRETSRHLICRFRYNHVITSIWEDTFPKVMRLCFPDIKYKKKTQSGFIEFENGSQIWFGGVDSKERSEKILGNEYSTIFAGECSQIDYESIIILLTRLAEKTHLKKRFFYDCNPPSKAHWTYKIFIKGFVPGTKEKMNTVDYGSLLMNPNHNKENLEQVYLDILANLPLAARRRFEAGEFLSDVEGALWSMHTVNMAQSHIKSYADLQSEIGVRQVVIGVDPSIKDKKDSDLCGIIVVAQGNDNKFYVIDDQSLIASPNTWAQRVIDAYEYYSANLIIVEVNQGGDMVKTILQSKSFYGKIVEVHASKSKHARAEPVEAMYEREEVKHLNNDKLRHLEDELTSYVPLTSDKSPDRLDALVWALSLFVGKKDTLTLVKNADWSGLARASRGG